MIHHAWTGHIIKCLHMFRLLSSPRHSGASILALFSDQCRFCCRYLRPNLFMTLWRSLTGGGRSCPDWGRSTTDTPTYRRQIWRGSRFRGSFGEISADDPCNLRASPLWNPRCIRHSWLYTCFQLHLQCHAMQCTYPPITRVALVPPFISRDPIWVEFFKSGSFINYFSIS